MLTLPFEVYAILQTYNLPLTRSSDQKRCLYQSISEYDSNTIAPRGIMVIARLLKSCHKYLKRQHREQHLGTPVPIKALKPTMNRTMKRLTANNVAY